MSYQRGPLGIIWHPGYWWHRIVHRLRGPQRGCSCSRCFYHPKRRVPASEFYKDRLRLCEVERRLCEVERQVGIRNE